MTRVSGPHNSKSPLFDVAELPKRWICTTGFGQNRRSHDHPTRYLVPATNRPSTLSDLVLMCPGIFILAVPDSCIWGMDGVKTSLDRTFWPRPRLQTDRFGTPDA